MNLNSCESSYQYVAYAAEILQTRSSALHHLDKSTDIDTFRGFRLSLGVKKHRESVRAAGETVRALVDISLRLRVIAGVAGDGYGWQ